MQQDTGGGAGGGGRAVRGEVGPVDEAVGLVPHGPRVYALARGLMAGT